MDTKNDKVDDGMDWYYHPDPEEVAAEAVRDSAFRKTAAALFVKVRAGEITEDECAAELLRVDKELGSTSSYTPEQQERSVRNFMMHFLHGAELARLAKEKGIHLS
jgi:hypothetical protein